MTKTLLITFAWMLLLFAFVLIVPFLPEHPFSYEADAIVVEGPKTLWHLANFDGAHYQNIARYGYIAAFQTAFFPLYPLLVRFISLLTHNYLLSAVTISVISLLGSMLIIYRLAGQLAPVLLLLSFPTAFYLICGYTESLFIFLSLVAWYLVTRRQYLYGSFFGLLATACRFYGIFLLPTLFMRAVSGLPRQSRFKLNTYLPYIPLLAIPFGLLFYMIYLYFAFNDPLQFIHALDMWKRSNFVLPPQTIYRYLKIIFLVDPDLFQYRVAVLELVFFLLGLALSVYLQLKRHYAEAGYLFIGTLFPALTGTLASSPRYLLSLMPFVFINLHLKTRILIPLVVASFALQLLLFYSFLTGRFVG